MANWIKQQVGILIASFREDARRLRLDRLMQVEHKFTRRRLLLLRNLLILSGAALWATLALGFHRVDWDFHKARLHSGFILFELRQMFAANGGAIPDAGGEEQAPPPVLPTPQPQNPELEQVAQVTAQPEEEPEGGGEAQPQPPRRYQDLVLEERWAVYMQGRADPVELDRELFARPFRALFAANVFQHVWLVAVAFWLAYRAAALYLNHVFELEDLAAAERFLLQSALASRYNTLNIQDGKVAPGDSRSNLARIGGPGLVRVHLENAALFETFDRRSRVIAPGNGPRSVVELAPFEHLRQVFQLQDHVTQIEVEGRTRDGIRIRAEQVRMLFRIRRGRRKPTAQVPYPFDEKAIFRLVYNRGKTSPWTSAMTANIHREFQNFFAKRTLSDFLANIGQTEVDLAGQREKDLRQAAKHSGGQPADPPAPPGPPTFEPRPAITQQFLQNQDGVLDLEWIDVGAWSLPDEAIMTRHQEAWKITYENLRQGSPPVLNSLQRQSSLAECLRLIHDVPLGTHRRGLEAGAPAGTLLLDLLVAYRDVLREAWEWYDSSGNASSPDALKLRRTLEFFSRFTYRWLGTPPG